MNSNSKIRLLLIVLVISQSTSCDLFVNEQAFEPNPVCEIEFYRVSEQPPELIGGLVNFLQSIKYPDEAKGSGVEGRVTVQFLILEDGTTTCLSVARGIG